jgi:hypothetical protein
MNQYVRGATSSLEAAVLGLLLKRISSPSSLLALLDEQAKVVHYSTFLGNHYSHDDVPGRSKGDRPRPKYGAALEPSVTKM